MNKGLLLVTLFVLGGLLAYRSFHQDSQEGTFMENVEPKTLTGERSSNMKTNAWFSSVYKGFPTAPLFALPGAYKFDEAGLSIGFPVVTGTPNTVFGSFQPVCSLGTSGKTTDVKLVRYGDWDALFEVTSGNALWKVRMSQGSPVVAIDDFQGELSVTCEDGGKVSTVEGGILVTRGTERILIQAKGSSSFGPSPMTGQFRLVSSEQSYRIILLPQTTDRSVGFFAALPWTTIHDTRTVIEEQDGNIETTYAFQATDDLPVLTTLWPHHHLVDREQPVILGTYRTVLGTFRLIETRSFVTVQEIPNIPLAFRKVNDPVSVEAIKQAIREDVMSFGATPPPTGVYFLGTWLGGLASVVQLADLYGMEDERETLLDILGNNLVASLPNFMYQDYSKMLVAKNTEFGNDQGNDHHFHYGYYLRSAAVLITLRPELKEQLMPVMNELAWDIATTDRTSTRYPYIRNFSPYDGHSWADGYAIFNDGNNQESTSEALNAWYGLSLWGRVTDNSDFEKTGRALFATELAATKVYWFGENNPFPTGYDHAMASMVWGGKRDYATWFSGQTMHIHGIQWLPITPASSYLAMLPNFTERNSEILRAHPNPASHEWGDLYVAHLSFFDPGTAERLLSTAAKNQAMKSRALLYQTVYQNLENR